MSRRILRFALSAASAGLAHADESIVLQPYEPDAHTLHLWHLDEAGTPFADHGTQPQPLEGLHNGALAGRPSIPGLGNAVYFHTNVGGTPGESDLRGGILTSSPILATGPQDNVDSSFTYFGPDGAFTYEMIVKLDILPQDARSIALGLISMDGDGSDRIFNCRIEKGGFLAFIPLPHGGATGGAIATIPTSGPHAIDTESWFHVALTYDGNGGVTNNLKLYWTRISPGLTAANRIGSGTLSSDLNGLTGDFAIGNEARSFQGNAEAEPFPGLIDEVRISGVARHPTDFLFVPADGRISPGQTAADPEGKPRGDRPGLSLASILVNGSPATVPESPGGILELGAGLHRLDFDFGFDPETIEGAVKLRCQLEGVDERWQETDVGMSLGCQVVDADGRVLSQYRFQSIGRSTGWESSLEDSAMTRRVEPVFIPAGAAAIRVTLTSGSAETTGFLAIRNLSLTSPGQADDSIWENESFSGPVDATSPADVPPGWRRAGTDPAIARMIFRPDGAALGLVDGDQDHHADWTAIQALDPPAAGDRTLILSWDEAYNVIGSGLHRATYINVPPGRYTFRAVGMVGDAQPMSESISLPILIHPPFWQLVWFWPLVATAAATVLAAGMIAWQRQRLERRLDRLRFQNALETDRTRIASDMHDDLGTRVTVINMTAALARRDLDQAPEKAGRHLSKLAESARDLVIAMDDLVWAVDPSHDSLDELASHVTRLADEIFRDTPIRCRLDIPALLPELPLGSGFRHHIALAVKEALHNILRHAGPCEVFLSLSFDGEEIRIVIRDTGKGFDPGSGKRGHGLDNLARRMHQIHGTCQIVSSPGHGTTVTLSCRRPARPTDRTRTKTP